MRPPLRPLFRTPIATPNTFSSKRIGARALNMTVAVLLLVVMALGVTPEANAQTPLTFTKSFSPSTIGPGSTTTLEFVITNILSPTGPANNAEDVAFTDVLPAGV